MITEMGMCIKWCITLRMCKRRLRSRRVASVVALCVFLSLLLFYSSRPILCDSIAEVGADVGADQRECRYVTIATTCESTTDLRDLVEMMTSLLYFRSRGLDFHIFSSHDLHPIVERLFTTWNIRAVNIKYHTAEKDATWTKTQIFTHFSYTSAVDVLLVHPQVRFLSDVHTFFIKYHKPTPLIPEHGPMVMVHYFVDRVAQLATMDCSWLLTPYCNTYQPDRPRAILSHTSVDASHCLFAYTYYPCLCSLLYQLQSVDPHTYREPITTQPLNCTFTDNTYVVYDTTVKRDLCYRYRRAVTQTYLTHMYYYGAVNVTYQQPVNPRHIDVTLVTVLTMNRFHLFVKTATNWSGHVIAVVYGTSEELHTLIPNVTATAVLRNSQHVTYHIVYKNEDFVPLNYLRNLGLNTSRTMYTFYNDVDLVPVPGLHDKLVAQLTTWARRTEEDTGENKWAFIVPAFNWLPQHDFEDAMFPNNSVAVRRAWKAGLVDTWKIWPFGHSITAYDTWIYSKDMYKVNYEHHSEPYVVLKTSDMPRYNESLPDGMRDKIQYTFLLYVLKYNFIVLPEVFLVHLPHQQSYAHYAYESNPITFNQCTLTLYLEYVLYVQQIYPKMILPYKLKNEFKYLRILERSRHHGRRPQFKDIVKFMWKNLQGEISDNEPFTL